MRIVILTGGELRHKYFANTIARAFDVVHIFVEQKALKATGKPDLSPEDEQMWDWHFNLAKEEEEKFFGTEKDFAAPVTLVPHGEINTSESVEKIRSWNPDTIVVFGSSLLKQPIIDICPQRILNMHLGLSPYYRGSATNFWPLYNGEPQYVGVTIHLIDPGIDTGPIAHQGRPDIERNDNQHSIGNKTIQKGTALMLQTLHELESGSLILHPQQQGGKLYQRKDFSVEAIKKLKQQLEERMIENYLEKRGELDTIIYIS